MRVAILGRTKILLNTAKLLHKAGFEIPIIGTCKAEPYYDVKEDDFEKLAKQINADFFISTKLSRPQWIEQLQRASCDIAVSVNWTFIIQKQTLDLFKKGVLNGHAGDLPKYRGNACPNWAILNGEDKVGLSIHSMIAGELDSGPIYLKKFFELRPSTYIQEVYTWMENELPEMFLEVLKGINSGSLTAQPQDTKSIQPLRCYPRRSEDGKIDWTQSAEKILRLIRASSRPFDGAFTSLEGGEKVTIWKAELFEHPGDWLAVPGQVLFSHGGSPVIACGGSCLVLTETSMAGAESHDLTSARVLKSLRQRLI